MSKPMRTKFAHYKQLSNTSIQEELGQIWSTPSFFRYSLGQLWHQETRLMPASSSRLPNTNSERHVTSGLFVGILMHSLAGRWGGNAMSRILRDQAEALRRLADGFNISSWQINKQPSKQRNKTKQTKTTRPWNNHWSFLFWSISSFLTNIGKNRYVA